MRSTRGSPASACGAVGPEAVAARLAAWYPGPGRLVEWSAGEHADGAAVRLERVDEGGGARRERHYLRTGGGRVTRHWIDAAPPRSVAPVLAADQLAPPAALLSRWGNVADCAPLVSSGWSGDALIAVTMTDGRRFVAKRIVPGGGWIGAHTGDPGRERTSSGTDGLARMPRSLDPAILDAEEAGEAWWVLMTDVSDHLWPNGRRIPRAESARVLCAADAMWRAFWGLRIPCLASLAHRLDLIGPEIAERQRAGLDLLPNQLEAAWEAFAEAAPRDVADAVLATIAIRRRSPRGSRRAAPP